MASFYRDIIALLKADGWMFHRHAKGSHEVWLKPSTGQKAYIPYDCRKRHTANGILKDAGIAKKL